ncbi:MAG TPA: SemiSWEET transporter [Desulfuromonadales bacterium]|jgi:MtN3 and saliva related transmembrane protein|nr:SemiSWEET transporter [Desulfuromonadales bacterium]
MALVDAVGYFAASCTTLAFLPQAVKVLRDKDTKSLSLGMYVLFTVGVGLWLAYGILKDDYVITLANAITIILSLAILVTKIRFDVLPGK